MVKREVTVLLLILITFNVAVAVEEKISKENSKSDVKCNLLCRYVNKLLKKYKIEEIDNKILKGYPYFSDSSAEETGENSIDLEVNFYGKGDKKEKKGLFQLISKFKLIIYGTISYYVFIKERFSQCTSEEMLDIKNSLCS
jgi:hypothetical protein